MNHYSINVDGEEEVQLHVILPSALPRGEWPVTSVGRFTPGEAPFDSVSSAKYVNYIQAMLYTDVSVPYLFLAFLHF